MFLGHYGVAFGAKRIVPRASLGTLAFAAQFLDELWPLLLLAGVEHVRIAPGLMAANGLEFVSYPFSHSLLTAAIWGLLIGGVYFAARRDKRTAFVVGGLVLSHWLLDAPMHHPDLPLWPGSSILIGGGLWNSIPLTLLLDGGIFVVGLAMYLRDTRASDRIGQWGLWSMVAVLVVIGMTGVFAPSPASEHALAVASLSLWLFVPWAYWVDRHRVANVAVAGLNRSRGRIEGTMSRA
jgi:membrane-bound metal-dependent hydrolase YbcI (DUF457 family)